MDRFIPDRAGLDLFSWLGDWIDSVEQRFNGGETRHGLAALGLTVGSIFLVLLLVQTLFAAVNIFLRFGLDILTMYFLIQISKYLQTALDVYDAIESEDTGKVDDAVSKLAGNLEEQSSDVNAVWSGTAGVLSGMNHWFFTPVFWFLLLGPAGAVLVYTTGITAKAWDWKQSRFQNFGKAAQYLYQGLAWIPVRLLAISYALLGNFENVLHAWSRARDVWSGSSEQLLISIGMGALSQENENKHPDSTLLQRAVALEHRVVLFWAVTGFAIAVTSYIS